ncbi:Hypothetical predicted protein [Mytilus galloprovincialis]|uniref:Uncharacterized protein n=1 Tax=Mytilus galloprovincialis TaxID=29158 RepID=A0A8B6EV13_MYTGA|nr:Hypothetical predicted protein [Mytilus galloprovincialis]
MATLIKLLPTPFSVDSSHGSNGRGHRSYRGPVIGDVGRGPKMSTQCQGHAVVGQLLNKTVNLMPMQMTTWAVLLFSEWISSAKKFIELTRIMITQSILSKMENHEPPKSKTVANQDVGENIFSDIFTRFTEIFFLLPVTGRRKSVWMDDKIVGSINNTRYYEYIPRGAPNPVLLMFCEVKRFQVQESEDTDTWINRKLPKTVLEQVGAELVAECFSSAFLPNVLAVICMRTEVIFVYLTIASDHVKAIRNKEEIKNKKACIHYTEVFDIMKKEDRKHISELLFWLGCVQKGNLHRYYLKQ